jgi:hypothetical protein|eukprot:SAG25_NODE_6442_length_559_cov_1.117391_2_plen_49_part_00
MEAWKHGSMEASGRWKHGKKIHGKTSKAVDVENATNAIPGLSVVGDNN